MYVLSGYMVSGYVWDINEINDLTPNYGASCEITPRVLISEMEGYQQRVEELLNQSPRKWQVTFTDNSNGIQTLDNFLLSNIGTSSFLWTPPRGSQGDWICSDWSVSFPGYEQTNLTATFEEVFV